MNQISKLVQKFSENVSAQAEAMRLGEFKNGNLYAKRYIQAFQSLRALGDEGRDGLVPLMFEGSAEVRAMAAAFLLRYQHDEARRVLQDLAGGTERVAAAAKETLMRWDEGSWQLDPE